MSTTSNVTCALRKLFLTTLGMLLLSSVEVYASAATTLYVSPIGKDDNPGTTNAPYRTIQAAVNNATNGDTILLEDGIYSGNGNRNIDFSGRNITLNSRNGASKTIMDCGGSETEGRRAFYFHSKETAVLLSGITVIHGTISGAILVKEGSIVKIARCKISECIGDIDEMGGAIRCDNGKVTATECTISNNPSIGVSGSNIMY